MNRKSRIVVVLVALGLVPAAASPVALAGSPLLSGYGGPGTGEQSVIGSTLIGRSGGGSGSGGSSGSTGSGSGSTGSTSYGSGSAGGGGGSTAPGTTSAVTGGSSAGGSGASAAGKGASSARGAGSGARGSASAGAGSNASAQIRAFVYPTALRSASVDPPTLGISGSDWLLFGLAIATLALVAVATVRLSRLQRQL